MKQLFILTILSAALAMNAMARGAAEPTTLHVEEIEPIYVQSACVYVRAEEPRADITVKVLRYNDAVVMTRPIYSDLCEMRTAQFTDRLYIPLMNDSRTPAPIVGLSGSNEPEYPVFSKYVMQN
jgi:hypothetical protein